jgi:hypothetical protein
MSGLETVAAILRIADVAFRSISSIYDIVQNQRGAPKEIEKLRTRVNILRNSLAGLKFLEGANAAIHTTVKSIRLPEAFIACALSCEALEKHLPNLISSRKTDFFAKIKYAIHKKDTQNVLVDINTAKIRTILTLEVTSL